MLVLTEAFVLGQLAANPEGVKAGNLARAYGKATDFGFLWVTAILWLAIQGMKIKAYVTLEEISGDVTKLHLTPDGYTALVAFGTKAGLEVPPLPYII